MLTLLRVVFAVQLLCVAPLLAQATEARLLDADTVLLGDLVEGAPEQVAVELGAAPPPGGTRAFTRAFVEQRLREAGVTAQGLELPAVMRVQGAIKTFTQRELAESARPAVLAALRRGVELKKVEVRSALRAAPSATIERAVLPALTRRVGTQRVTATLEIEVRGRVVQRVPAVLELELTEAAVTPALPRGSRLDVRIAKGNASVSTAGVTLQAGDVGDVVMVRIEKTGKTLRVRIADRSRAEVVSS
jgi:hypothetical protein